MGDTGLAYAVRAEGSNETFEQLATVPPEMQPTDEALGKEMWRIVRGEPARSISQKEEETIQSTGKTLTGLQTLRMFYLHFGLDADRLQEYGLSDLLSLRDTRVTGPSRAHSRLLCTCSLQIAGMFGMNLQNGLEMREGVFWTVQSCLFPKNRCCI